MPCWGWYIAGFVTPFVILAALAAWVAWTAARHQRRMEAKDD
jgi:hypothetical protein